MNNSLNVFLFVFLLAIMFFIIKFISFIVNQKYKNVTVVGNNFDNEEKQSILDSNNGLTWQVIFMIIISMPVIIFSLNFIEHKIEEKVYNVQIEEEERMREYEKREKEIKEKERREKEIKEEFSALLDSEFIFLDEFLVNAKESKVRSISLLIVNDKMPNSETEFCDALVASYNNVKELLNIYKYDYQNIHFTFTDKNPFAKETSTAYQMGGYIKNTGNLYLIYLNPTPIKIYID